MGRRAADRCSPNRLSEPDHPGDDLDIQPIEEAVISGLSLVSVTAQAGKNVHRSLKAQNNTDLRLAEGPFVY